MAPPPPSSGSARVLGLLAAALAAAWAGPARGAVIGFGSGELTAAPNEQSGTAYQYSDVVESPTVFVIRAAVGADQAFLGPVAVSDYTYTYRVPYVVQRTVTVTPGVGQPATATFEILRISFDVRSEGGFYPGPISGSVTSASGYFVGSPTYDAGVDFSGPPALEPGSLPTDFRSWSDFLEPQIDPALYRSGGTFTQQISDTLIVSFRLRAESRPSGSISTDGGLEISCVGVPPGHDVFDPIAAGCNRGVVGTALVEVTGTSSVAVPEPGTFVALVAALGALAFLRGGVRSRPGRRGFDRRREPW